MRSYLSSPIDLHINKISFWKALKSKSKSERQRAHNKRPEALDWEHDNESKNFGIFKKISGFLGSLLGICTKLQLATLLLTQTSSYACNGSQVTIHWPG